MTETEQIRKSLVEMLNEEAAERAPLEARYGQGNVWNSGELAASFEVRAFSAPFVHVRRKSDGAWGYLCFQHSPRFYFDWQEAR